MLILSHIPKVNSSSSSNSKRIRKSGDSVMLQGYTKQSNNGPRKLALVSYGFITPNDALTSFFST